MLCVRVCVGSRACVRVCVCVCVLVFLDESLLATKVTFPGLRTYLHFCDLMVLFNITLILRANPGSSRRVLSRRLVYFQTVI